MRTQGFPDQLASEYEALFRKRFHGAGNHRSVCFHALYASLEAFTFLADDGPSYMLLEGIEDIDVYGETFGHLHIQLKDIEAPLSYKQIGDVFKSFAEILRANPNARFRLVSSSGFNPEMTRFVGSTELRSTAPAKLREKAKEACSSASLGAELLRRTTFEEVTSAILERRLATRVIRDFEVTSSNERLYVSTILMNFATFAGSRTQVTRTNLESIRLMVWEDISSGPTNLAVQNRLIEEVQFITDDSVNDYYSGRSARAAHIAGNVDVQRPQVLAEISRASEKVDVCAIVASSGQGKSSLAYRFASNSNKSGITLLVRSCDSEVQVGAISDFILNRLRLDVPIVVIVDNLSARTKSWHRLVERLVGRSISFLVTTREEDWNRYGQSTSGFTWRIVRPKLELAEARKIFEDLRRQSRIHQSVRSAEWAWERVFQPALLIEYVYLITQGTLLSERLSEQIAILANQDSGKLKALRYVSVGDLYGVSISVPQLLSQVQFAGDPLLSLQSLIGEYLVVDGDECRGLHPVRSRHLSDILLPFGRTAIAAELCSFIASASLPELVSAVLVDDQIDAGVIIQSATNRCLESELPLLEPLWVACYRASEQMYVESNREVIQRTTELFGNAGPKLLTYLAIPNSPLDLDEFLEIFGEEGSLQIRELISQLGPRNIEDRFDARFLATIRSSNNANRVYDSIEASTSLALAAISSKLPTEEAGDFLENVDWESLALNLDLKDLCSLCLVVQRTQPARFSAWIAQNTPEIEAKFKRETRTLAIRRIEERIVIRFWVESASEEISEADQATNRLISLAAIFPSFAIYETDPVYPFVDSEMLPFRDAYKAIPIENLYQDVDTRVNKAWREAMDKLLVADGWYSWAEAHSDVEREALPILRIILARLYQHIDSKAISESLRRNAVESFFRWDFKWRRIPSVPVSSDAIQARKMEEIASNWSSSLGNTINLSLQLLETIDDTRLQRLVRINSWNLAKVIEPFEKTLQEARKLSGLDNLPSLAPRTKEICSEISLAISYIEAQGPPSPNARQACVSFKNREDQTILEVISSAFSGVDSETLDRIILPDKVHADCPESKYSDMPFPSLFFGLKINALRQLDEELRSLLLLVASFLPDFQGYLYVFAIHPNGRLPHAMKANCQTLARILNGEEPAQAINFFPIELTVIPSCSVAEIAVWTPVESSLFERFIRSLEKAAIASAIYVEGARVLSDELLNESELLASLRTEFENSFLPGAPLNESLLALRNFNPPASSAEIWNQLNLNSAEAVEISRSQPEGFLDVLENLSLSYLDYLDTAYPVPSRT